MIVHVSASAARKEERRKFRALKRGKVNTAVNFALSGREIKRLAHKNLKWGRMVEAAERAIQRSRLDRL